MISNDRNTYDSIIREMGAEKGFEFFNSKQKTEAATQEALISLCDKPKNITYKDGQLCIIESFEGKEDVTQMIDFELGVQECGNWLSQAIAQPPFDVTQDGNIRKSDEAESAFTCAVIVGILNNENFKKEYTNIAEHYDYKKMVSLSDSDFNFKDLLEDWQKLNSFIINVIVSACKKRISEQKKDDEKFLRDGLTPEELIGLKDLRANISRVIYQYTGPKGPLNPDNLVINKLKKVEILQQLTKQHSEIKDLVESSEFGTIYKIFNLSTEYIDPIKKKDLKYIVLDKTEKYYDQSQESNDTDKEVFIKKLNARVLRVQRTSIRRAEILKYIKNRDSYSLPSKL